MGLTSKIDPDQAFLSEKVDLHALMQKRDFIGNLHKEDKDMLSVSVSNIKLPSSEPELVAIRDDHEEEEEEGCITPKLAVDTCKECPPAPRKPKPLPSTKRKMDRALLDVSIDEIESIFPSHVLELFCSGYKMKKVRK
ncbi:cyclin-dependent protein kinase inhibitor SMR3-like [Primulina tabacum]|uniref:cyclin-dependent protein kinase inhibitor SMR3-like n=1 Tax=Primulina tabacum TaxID=48773 RepID=UPI003F59D8CA